MLVAKQKKEKDTNPEVGTAKAEGCRQISRGSEGGISELASAEPTKEDFKKSVKIGNRNNANTRGMVCRVLASDKK